ncbi:MULTISPECIES: hypothetical protein [Halomonadaceae]|uniref:hypothetical protein n=1 Tax=Halomonadaceae TaxID=28256 RepID=UPI0015985D24|nr:MULTISPECIES: hypothetical protein [Halomonas]QJQ94076.1 hypothetical protein HIO72_01385 [Halomonas sp. PA5]
MRKQRTVLAGMLWSMAALSAPYATYCLVTYGPMAILWPIFFGLLLFSSAMLCTHINERLNERQDNPPLRAATLEETKGEDAPSQRGRHIGLCVLRIGKGSPLRGKINEKAILLTINGQHPTTAEQANHALVVGENRIEWMGRNGKVITSRFTAEGEDLLVQFEQVTLSSKILASLPSGRERTSAHTAPPPTVM